MKDITDKIVREWADRHGLDGIPLETLRCALDDARSIPELTTPSQPSCVQDARDGENDGRRLAKARDEFFASLSGSLLTGAPLGKYLRNRLEVAFIAGWDARYALTGGVGIIAAERRRQIESEGWTPERDDGYADEELAAAGACYAMPEDNRNYGSQRENREPFEWPWASEWWKPGDRIRELAKAGALIAAEIDRLQRAAITAKPGEGEEGGG